MRLGRARAALLERLLFESREELVRADGKASILLAAAGVVVGAGMAATLAGDWSPTDLNCFALWPWWLGVASVLTGIAALGHAVYPRTTRKKSVPHLVAFYGDIAAFATDSHLKRAIDRTVANPDDRTLDQVRVIAGIVESKYASVRLALVAFALGAVLFGIVIAVNLTGI